MGLNSKCRFLRYEDGDGIQPHRDTAWTGHDDPRTRSWLTLIAYLNDNENFAGGETTFFVDDRRVSVSPKRGAALLFFHGFHRNSTLHEGSVVSGGSTKHVLRTDVLYEVRGETAVG